MVLDIFCDVRHEKNACISGPLEGSTYCTKICPPLESETSSSHHMLYCFCEVGVIYSADPSSFPGLNASVEKEQAWSFLSSPLWLWLFSYLFLDFLSYHLTLCLSVKMAHFVYFIAREPFVSLNCSHNRWEEMWSGSFKFCIGQLYLTLIHVDRFSFSPSSVFFSLYRL